MANKNYYRWGDQELIKVPVNKTTVVEIGDFICLVTSNDNGEDSTLTVGYGCPATYVIDSVADAAAARELGADQLLGIAMSASLNGQEEDLLVATAGVFELVQKSALAVALGDPVEIYADATNCEDQTIVCGTALSAIGRCVERKTSTTLTGVMVKLIPPLMNLLAD